MMDELDAKLHRIGQHHFRAKFRLRGRDRAIIDLRGITTVRKHASELIATRLAPAEPRNDGKQTPYRVPCSWRSMPPRPVAAPASHAGMASPLADRSTKPNKPT